MINLRLDRPLTVFDLETTGINPHHDRIVEVSALKIKCDGKREKFHQLINPEQQIPQACTAIHGITNEDVEDAPKFFEIAPELNRFVSGCDLAGFGIVRFDVPLLAAEFRRVGIEWNLSEVRLVDAQIIYHLREPRNLSAALEFYCGEKHNDAHSAEGDVLAALKVIEAQCQHYQDLPKDVVGLDGICNPCDPDAVDRDGKLRWCENEVVIAFGQKSGITLRDIAENEPSYLNWMLKKDFSLEVKTIVKRAMAGQFPSRRN